MAALALGTLPVYLRVGEADEAHVGDLEVTGTSYDGGTTVKVNVDYQTTLVGLLRAVADEIEHPSADDD